jgi:transcriptional regulator with XRE-family HTH domain
MIEKPNPREVALRLRAIVRKLGLSVEAAAQELGMTRERLNNSINGYVNPRHETVYALQQMLPGITLEWVYFGDDRLVPSQLARELAIFVEAARQKLELPVVPPEPEPPARKKASRASPRPAARANACR